MPAHTPKTSTKRAAGATATAPVAPPVAPTAPSPTATTPDSAPPYLTSDPVAALAHFRAEAAAIPVEKTTRLNIDPDLLVRNVGNAMTGFTPLLAAVVAAIPAALVNRFLELPSLALAVLYAADQVIGSASSGEIAQRLAAVGRLRTPMLAMLEVFASAPIGLADPARVHALRIGKGSLDKAHDAVNIAAYLTELWSLIVGKHPFTLAQVAELAAGGQWLIENLSPAGAVPVAGAPDPAAVLRDQLWTLLTTRYNQLRAAVAVVVGLDGLDAVIPPLNTRVAAKKPAAVPPATPAPATPAPATPAH